MDCILSKRPSDSCTEQVQIIMPEDINGYNRLFGGKLMQWIDVVASVTARRHSGCNVTTAAIDNLQFSGPAYVNSTMVLKGRVTYVGSTSMEVRVDTFVETLSGRQKLINRAYLVMVALDEHESPVTVPRLIVESDEDKAEWEAGKRRSELRRQRRAEQY